MPSKKDPTSSPYFKATPTRRSTRVSASTTPTAKKRKQYTEPDTDEDASQPTSASDKESNFDESADDSTSDFKKTGKNNGSSKRVKRDDDYVSEEEEEEEDDNDEEDDSADEGRQMKRTVIPLPKLRDEGEMEYRATRIHQNTMLFLRDLRKNNNRDWMKCEFLHLFMILRHSRVLMVEDRAD